MATRKKSAAKPAAKKPPQEAKPLSVRSFEIVKGPPGILGYNHMISPDEAFGKTQFKGDVHYTPQAKAVLLDRINAAFWELIPDLQEQAKANKVDGKLTIPSKADIFEHLSGQFKEPKEGFITELPYFQFKVNATYMYKGEEQAVTIKLFDQHGAPLDLKASKIARESIVMPMLTVGAWAGSSPYSKWVALPTIRLVGFQVLKLKQYARGDGQGGASEVSASDLALLGDNFSADDLSMFAKPANPKGEPQAPADEMDDEIPF